MEGRRKEGRKVGRKEGRKEGGKEGRKGGRKGSVEARKSYKSCFPSINSNKINITLGLQNNT